MSSSEAWNNLRSPDLFILNKFCKYVAKQSFLKLVKTEIQTWNAYAKPYVHPQILLLTKIMVLFLLTSHKPSQVVYSLNVYVGSPWKTLESR